MSEDTKLKTCANCTVWPTEFRLAGKTTSCAALGFSANDSCKNWEDKDSSHLAAFIRVREPSLQEIMANDEIREPWKAFKDKLAVTTAHYSEGSYYYFFDSEQASEAEKMAETLSKETYIQKTAMAVIPIHIDNLEEDDQRRFKNLAKEAQES